MIIPHIRSRLDGVVAVAQLEEVLVSVTGDLKSESVIFTIVHLDILPPVANLINVLRL